MLRSYSLDTMHLPSLPVAPITKIGFFVDDDDLLSGPTTRALQIVIVVHSIDVMIPSRIMNHSISYPCDVDRHADTPLSRLVSAQRMHIAWACNAPARAPDSL